MSNYKTILHASLKDSYDLVLSQAGPYVEKMYGKIMVIKCSGEVVSPQASSDRTIEDFATDIVCLRALGIKPVVVHGGGTQITSALTAAGIKSNFVNGLRATDSEAMEIVDDVLINQVGRDLTEAINSAVMDLLSLTRSQVEENISAEQELDSIEASQLDEELGFVGKVEAIATEPIFEKLDRGAVPIISSIGKSPGGQLYNINADTAASKIAVSLNAERLHILTNVDGVYADSGNSEKDFESESHISEMTIAEVGDLLKAEKIRGGMVPKLEACCYALQNGVNIAHILNGSKPNNLIVELFTHGGVGTMITPGRENEQSL